MRGYLSRVMAITGVAIASDSKTEPPAPIISDAASLSQESPGLDQIEETNIVAADALSQSVSIPKQPDHGDALGQVQNEGARASRVNGSNRPSEASRGVEWTGPNAAAPGRNQSDSQDSLATRLDMGSLPLETTLAEIHRHDSHAADLKPPNVLSESTSSRLADLRESARQTAPDSQRLKDVLDWVAAAPVENDVGSGLRQEKRIWKLLEAPSLPESYTLPSADSRPAVRAGFSEFPSDDHNVHLSIGTISLTIEESNDEMRPVIPPRVAAAKLPLSQANGFSRFNRHYLKVR